MAVLLIADVNDGQLALDPLAKALSAVTVLGEVNVLVSGPAAAAAEAATLSGVSKVLQTEDVNGLAEPMAALITCMAGGYSHIAGAATAATKNILPRVAALLDVMVISDVIAVLDAETFERPIYAGNALQTVRSSDAVKVFSIRTAAFAATAASGSAAITPVSAAAATGLSTFVENRVATSDRPELTSAQIVVSGGRGLASKENFAIIETLADKLGAAVGASRAAVDSGYAPNDWQVGQTGKVVAPRVYIAVGISGAIQHLAGMKDSKIIVAINKDEEAPIFQVADYGLVGDLFTIVPEFSAKL